MNDFFSELADILEVDAVGPGDVLEDFEDWDSLSLLSVVAMVDSKYRVSLSAAEIRSADTAQALFELVQARMAK